MRLSLGEPGVKGGRLGIGRPEPPKAAGVRFSASTSLLGHHFSSLTENSVHLKSSGSSPQLRPKSGWLAMVQGGFLSSCEVLGPESSPIKGCKNPASGAGQLLCVLCFPRGKARKTFAGRARAVAICTPSRPLDAGNSSHAPGGRGRAASARLIYIFRGGGWAAASSPGQCVN